jgi:hypothetical protein
VLPLIASLLFLLHPSSPFALGRLYRDSFFIPIYFFLAVNALNTAVCIGVLLRKKWAYHLFRIMMWLLFFGVPIGTLVSYFTLAYMRRHNIERHFGLPPATSSYPRGFMVTMALVAVALFLWMMLAY